MGDGTEPFALEDSAWEAACENAIAELEQDERAALIRVANGTATKVDAVLLAASLMHSDLFQTHTNGRVTPIEEDAE